MKVLLHVLLTGEDNIDITTNGIKTKNTYKYKEKDILVNVKVEKDILYINRKCNDYEINLVFKENNNTISTYTVFGGLKKFNLETKTNKLKISKDRIELEYVIEDSKFKYLLEVTHEGKIN